MSSKQLFSVLLELCSDHKLEELKFSDFCLYYYINFSNSREGKST